MLTRKEWQQVSNAIGSFQVGQYDDEYIHRQSVLNFLATFVEEVPTEEKMIPGSIYEGLLDSDKCATCGAHWCLWLDDKRRWIKKGSLAYCPNCVTGRPV